MMDWYPILLEVAKYILEVGKLLIPAFLVSLYITKSIKRYLQLHQFKIDKYAMLIHELGKLSDNNPNWDTLRPILNEALMFSSDELGAEILKFNTVVTEVLKEDGRKIHLKEITPIMKAIRKELGNTSKKMDKEGWRVFMKVKD